MLALPYQIPEVCFENSLLLIALVNLVYNVQLAHDLLAALVQVSVELELVLQVVIKSATMALGKAE